MRVPFVALLASTLAGCSSSTDSEGLCGTLVDLFPVPVDDETSLFTDGVDDSALEVAFDPEFSFPFYGVTYESVFLNSNGGMVFGAATEEELDLAAEYDVAASEIPLPGIAVFWGDMDAAATEEAAVRGNQMSYEACPDRFIVWYESFQDNDVVEWRNSATVTLHDDGRIDIVYGEVLSGDILVGIFDGTHTADTYPTLTSSYLNYPDQGTGILLFDFFELGAQHVGQLTNMTITYTP